MSLVGSWRQRLPPLFAVLTVSVGILAWMFVGAGAAVAVFVIGWPLLVPATGVVFIPSYGIDSGLNEAVNGRVKSESKASVSEGTRDPERDPIAEAKQQYARGEIDEQELERRLELLLETEDVDAADEDEIEQTIDHISRSRTGSDKEVLTAE
jgi:hypothetical protein